ncbi:MAG: MBL fold metallo-hydrolase [Limnochordia bacterium]|jgi:L-ascorbate 6-phosphate lactonase
MPDGSWVRHGEQLIEEIDRTKVPADALALWYLGQMGLVIKGADTTVYIDPYLSDPYRKDDAGNSVPRRRYPPPFAGSDIRHADVVLGTHNHSDHMDLPSLQQIASASLQARFVVPAPHVDVLTGAGIADSRVLAAQVGQPLKRGPLTITPIPAAHEELEQDLQGDYTCVGYILQLNGITLYHSGDTVEYPEMVSALSAWDLDVVCLPINGRDLLRRRRNIVGNMNFREAADVAVAAGAGLIIPMHYDMFAHNGENPAFFVDYIYRTYPAQPFKIMAPGERLVYVR